jgi:hypothetical protein
MQCGTKSYLKSNHNHTPNRQSDSRYFSKCFSLKNILKLIFLYFLKLFLISAHQNDLKTPKIY